ncbi:flagellar hook-length control protein FliK [Pseudomonas gingeri NCPPB 3146 = LMG 5327]|uniref:Flagellar hook-length control protein FliK n=2 Tax=Pseudomonas gingeri TaxID=117681 RepID=A0A7Y8CGN9_9PSED|nr:type III secretion system HrpP C-terminal domain-containing protein [Pseudomonas gingeri]NWC18164.1 flagellar hook-length control protein FliK [Pseudomonas gingeri]PNQ90924.1 flagellar hook-length control protein FliK [Pseudomonas gingeri NCPPB 3146 = LMG 5327]
MTTPIKPAPPHPAHRPAPAARAPQAENRLPSPAFARRAETERSRQSGSAFGASRDSGEMTADGLFFEQLLAPSASDQGDQSEQHGGSGFSLFQAAEAIPTQLIDELALQLPARGDRPFSATLLMPNLGKVQVRAGRRDNQWTIDLGFERADVLNRLSNNRQACEDVFSQALGREVNLSLHGTGTA